MNITGRGGDGRIGVGVAGDLLGVVVWVYPWMSPRGPADNSYSVELAVAAPGPLASMAPVGPFQLLEDWEIFFAWESELRAWLSDETIRWVGDDVDIKPLVDAYFPKRFRRRSWWKWWAHR